AAHRRDGALPARLHALRLPRQAVHGLRPAHPYRRGKRRRRGLPHARARAFHPPLHRAFRVLAVLPGRGYLLRDLAPARGVGLSALRADASGGDVGPVQPLFRRDGGLRDRREHEGFLLGHPSEAGIRDHRDPHLRYAAQRGRRGPPRGLRAGARGAPPREPAPPPARAAVPRVRIQPLPGVPLRLPGAAHRSLRARERAVARAPARHARSRGGGSGAPRGEARARGVVAHGAGGAERQPVAAGALRRVALDAGRGAPAGPALAREREGRGGRARGRALVRRARAVLVFAALLATAALADDGLVVIPTRPGVKVGYWMMERPGAVATLLLLPGGEGGIGMRGGRPASTNFLVRSRDLFAARGFNVAIVGKPTDHDDLDEVFRATPSHVEDIGRVVEKLHAQYGKPVWLVGTSRGTISAAAAAIGLGDAIAGVVLTSSI